MRILGIDPGTEYTGWGLLDYRDGQVSLVDAGHFVCTSAKKEWYERAWQMLLEVQAITRLEPLTDIAIELPFVLRKNPDSSVKLIAATGMYMAVMISTQVADPRIELHILRPTEIKKLVTGAGNSRKERVAGFLTGVWDLPVRPSARLDTTDAIACAVAALRRKTGLEIPC